MTLQSGNLLARPDAPLHGETADVLLATASTRVVRIVSNEHSSPPGFWYDQDDDEWVVVIEGGATLEFDDGRRLAMAAGDWAAIPAHTRHRIAATSPRTVWVAVHSGPTPATS